MKRPFGLQWPVINICAVILIGGCAPSGSSNEPAMTRVETYLRHLAADSTRSGAVLVARDGNVVARLEHGYANVELSIPVRPGHLFRIGSLTKPITASAVLRAIELERFSLESGICDFLSGCPVTWQPVTVRNLLSHTSGIPDHFGSLEAVPVGETVAELRRVMGELDPRAPLRAPVGTTYAYSNFNYVLLGALLEAVYEAPWETVLDSLVFQPMDLASIRYDDVFEVVPDRMRGYQRAENGGLRNTEYDDHAAYAAGGLLATIDDLHAFVHHFLNGQVVGPDLVELSFTPVQENYGLGWQVREFFGRDIVNHTGGIDGFSSHVAHYRDESLTIIVLSNVEDDSAILTACDVAAVYFGVRSAMADAEDMEPRERCGVPD